MIFNIIISILTATVLVAPLSAQVPNESEIMPIEQKATPSSNIRILLGAALTPAYFDFRKNQYITTFNQLKSLGYEDFYVVEALSKLGPTFLNEHCKNVFYSTANNPRFKNNGINEARTLHEASHHFKFAPDDMIIKLTGRYQLINDSFFKLVKDNPDTDVFVRVNEYGDVFTLCYAMRCKYFQEMYAQMDYEKMERQWINVEREVGNYIKRKKQQGNFKVIYVEKLGVIANLLGSSTAPGTPEQINTY